MREHVAKRRAGAAIANIWTVLSRLARWGADRRPYCLSYAGTLRSPTRPPDLADRQTCVARPTRVAMTAQSRPAKGLLENS